MPNQACYAAYFNVARHNLLIALNHIAQKSGLSSIENDDQIANHPILRALEGWQKTEEKDKTIKDKDIRIVKQVVKGLQKALPILGDDFVQAISGQSIGQGYLRPKRNRDGGDAADADQPQQPPEKSSRTWRLSDLHWVLKMLVDALMEQRNFYSHAHQNPVGMSEPLMGLLVTWFDAGRREAKSRLEFLNHELEHLLLRFDTPPFALNPAAPHALATKKSGTHRLTERGTAYFCCLFLDKQQGSEFLKQIPGFKADDGRYSQATLRTYLHWSIRLPFVRIETINTAQSLALDVFNELARCPGEIYEHMGEKRQKEFEIKPDVDDPWRTAQAEGDGAGDGMVTRYIRHADRFAPLTMDCFDHMGRADPQLDVGIRFQLDLGDFYFAAYPKKLPDGSTDVRRLKQKVLRFGLLSEALSQSEAKPQPWQALERVNTERDYGKPYIVETRPHYHLPDTGSIPIKIKSNCQQFLYAAPQADLDKPGRFQQIESERPDFWLSPYELVNLAFYHHLRSTHTLPESEFPKVENLLSSYRSSVQRLYSNIQQRPADWRCNDKPALEEKLRQFSNQPTAKSYYTLLPQDLPADLLNLLLRQAKSPDTVIHQQAQNTLRLLMDDGENRLAQVQAVKYSLNERTKPGKPGYRVLRAGEMATFLAKDMLRFQPVQDENSPHKGKPTSIMVDLLQARLAYFGRDKTSLPALFNSLHLTGNGQADKNHPFLHRIQINAAGMHGIAQFYEAYLRVRRVYLQGLHYQLSQGASVLGKPAFAWLKVEQAGKRLEGKDDVAKLVTQYLQRMAEPLNLPRGLFRELTVKALLRLDHADLKAELQANLDKEAGRGRFTSTSKLVALYFLHVQKDASQNFYSDDLPRLKKRFDDLVDEENYLKQTNPRLTPTEVEQALQQKCAQRLKTLDNFKHDLDRTRSHRATQDQVLFLAARQLIDLDTKRNKGTQQAAQDGATETMFDKLRLQTLKRDDLNQMVPHAVRVAGKTIFEEQVKAKNIGRFKSLARDRRLPGVLHYYPEDRIPANLVAHELQAYPRAQNQAMEHVLAYEDVRNARQKLQAFDPAVKGSLHRTLIEQHLKQVKLPHDDPAKLQAEALTLRNAFCHNQIPVPSKEGAPENAMLEQAEECLASARQAGKGLDAIKGGKSVAQHFANALHARYQVLNPTEEKP